MDDKILVPMVGTGLLVTLHDVLMSQETSLPKQLFGVTFGTILLLFIGQANQDFAAAMAWLVFIAAIFVRGIPVLGAFSGSSKPATTKGATK